MHAEGSCEFITLAEERHCLKGRGGLLQLDEDSRAEASRRTGEKVSKQIVKKLTQFTENEGNFRCSLSASQKLLDARDARRE